MTVPAAPQAPGAPRRLILLSVLLAAVVAASSGCRGAERTAAPAAPAAPVARASRPLAEWRFLASDTLTGAEATTYDDGAWQRVTVPHTWSVEDPRTHRSSWYRTTFAVDPTEMGDSHYVAFDGVAVRARVFLNGALLGEHLGAYTRFVLDAGPALRAGDNVLAVRVGNDPQDTADSLPSGTARQLYRVSGGITRRAWLLRTARVHVDPLDMGASGVFVTTTEVSGASARLSVRTRVRNASPAAASVQVDNTLLDAKGGVVLRLQDTVSVAPGAVRETTTSGSVSDPQLWGPGHPYLYRVRTELSTQGAVADRVEERVGFRDLRLRDGRFFLNGEPITLRGLGKHDESERHGQAVTDDDIRRDFDLLADLGVNVVRLAHYPHPALAYDLADERGLLVWAENGHSNPHKSGDDGERITREMVRQHFNHPSIVMWSVGNEAAFLRVARYAQAVRQEDPGRLVTYATNVDPNPKQGRELDFVGRNTYLGWYAHDPWELGQPGLFWPFISENGAGSVVSVHSDYRGARHVVDEYEPEEYRQVIAEAWDQLVFREYADRLPMYLVWILRDFGVEKYKGRVNTKGLVTLGGLKKDAYFLYRSYLRPGEPLVHVASQTGFLRRGRADNGIKVYSNLPSLRLLLDGEDMGTRRNGEHRQANGRAVANVFYWKARLRQGRNEVLATDGAGHEGRAVVYFEGEGGRPELPRPTLVEGLVSTNPASRAWFVDAPVQEQWPFYYDLDGTADNVFDALPEEARGAGWIATRRLSVPAHRTELRFEARADATVLILCTDTPAARRAFTGAGFRDRGPAGEWRDDGLRLVPMRLLARDADAGDGVRVPALTGDYVVLVKARAAATR